MEILMTNDLENINGYNVTVDTNMKDIPKLNFLTKITEEDLTFKETAIVSDSQLSTIKTRTSILGIPKSSDENTYDYLFYGLASTQEVSDWSLVNYTKFNTTIIKGTAQFTAMTFKKGNDIVIAYRGTDFDDLGDWSQDLFYGLVGYAGQEGVTQDYARVVAKHYTKNNEDINIYVTGHSLGGYLAQIGGAALVSDLEYMDNVKEISYFNGMGLNFWSNIISKLTAPMAATFGINRTELNQFKNSNSTINKTQNAAKQALTNWSKNGGTLISHNINGDIISSLGTHIGKQIGYDAYNACINHHDGNKVLTDIVSEGIFKLIKNFLNKDISRYVSKYNPSNIINYVWMTHETDSFFGVLPYSDGTMPINIKVDLKMPTIIKYNKTATATLTVTTTNGALTDENLNINDFTTTNSKRLKITKVSKPKVKTTNTGKVYTYDITLKGGIVVGYANIIIKADVLRVGQKARMISSDYVLNLLSSNMITSSSVITRLR